MRTLFVIGAALVSLLAFAQPSAAQPPVVVGQSQAFSFDYTPADLAAGAVNRFEMQIDQSGFTSIGLPASFVDSGTLAGHESRRAAIPALTPGTHTLTLRACNAEMCGDISDPFAFVLAVKPAKVGPIRIVPASN